MEQGDLGDLGDKKSRVVDDQAIWASRNLWRDRKPEAEQSKMRQEHDHQRCHDHVTGV